MADIKNPFLLKTLKLGLTCLIFMPIFLLVAASEAHAGYLDPGSGSSFVQSIIAIMAFFGRMVDKVKSFFGFKKK